MIRQSQVDATHDASIWFVGGGTALNMNLIRFSDVILMAAEAEIEAGGLLLLLLLWLTVLETGQLVQEE